MDIEGLNLPPHQHREYPKVVYAGGDLKGATRVVRHAGEEAEAAAAGFQAIAPSPLDTPDTHVAAQEAAPADPLDHDGDGRKGGSKPGSKRKPRAK